MSVDVAPSKYARLGTATMTRLALLSAVGLILFVFEAHIPRPLPWMKLGLGNVASLLGLFWYGIRGAMAVTLVRLLLGPLLLGTLLTPAFLFSAGGGLASLGVMAVVYRYGSPAFSVIGISVWGALAHNMAQLLLAYVVLIRRGEVVILMPMLLLSSVVTGVLTGVLAYLVLDRLQITMGSERCRTKRKH